MAGRGSDRRDSKKQSKHQALENLEQEVEDRYKREQQKVTELRTKISVEKAHSHYLRQKYSNNNSNRPSTSQATGRSDGSYQSKQLGSKTIGIDARVALSNALGLQSSSTPSSRISSPSSSAHHTTLSLNERITQQRAMDDTSVTYVQEDDDNDDDDELQVDANYFAESSSSSLALTCPIINCGVQLSNSETRNEHLSVWRHSPCDPCKHLVDGRLEITTTAHVCPVCLARFETSKECLEHMVSKYHKALMEPVAIVAYACPQCLLLFPQQSECASHIMNKNHFKCAYAFKDDEKAPYAVAIPVPAKFVKDLIRHCDDLSWTCCCTDCDVIIDNPAELNKHLSHIIISNTEFSQDEAFGMFMIKSYMCVQCLRLFDVIPEDSKDGIHNCREGVLGMFIDTTLECTSFEQYVIRYGLPPVGSNSNGGELVSASSEESYPSSSCSLVNIPSSDNAKQPHPSSPVRNDSSTSPRPQRQAVLFSPEGFTPKRVFREKKKRSDGKNSANPEGTPSCCQKRRGEFDEGDDIVIVPKKLKSEQNSKISNKAKKNIALDDFLLLSSDDENELSTPKTPDTTSSQKPQIYGSPHGLNPWQKMGYNGAKQLPDPYSSLVSGSCNGQGATSTAEYSSRPETLDLTDSPQPDNSNTDTNDSFVTAVASHDVEDESIVLIEDECQTLPLPSYNDPNIPNGLENMRQIVFLDLDNWRGFWERLPKPLPDQTFVWGFYGGSMQWNEPRCPAYLYARQNGYCRVHKKCGQRKDAADFAICLMVGKMDERLPKHIPFTILSGDHGFLELEEQMRGSQRLATVINPHHKSNVEVYQLICSVGET